MLKLVPVLHLPIATVITLMSPPKRRLQTSGTRRSARQRQDEWHRKNGVLWFNGYPGVPKLPLVQRRRPAASSLNPVASVTPEIETNEEINEENPEPLC